MVGRLLDRGNFDDVDEAIKKRCENFQVEMRKFPGEVRKLSYILPLQQFRGRVP